MADISIGQQIDAIIAKHSGWKGDLLTQLRNVILNTEPAIVEEVKWKMATRPEGLPVWSKNGILCFAEIWKDNVKLLFPQGAHLAEVNAMFNTRLDSRDIRAIEYHDGDSVNDAELVKLLQAAIVFNEKKRA